MLLQMALFYPLSWLSHSLIYVCTLLLCGHNQFGRTHPYNHLKLRSLGQGISDYRFSLLNSLFGPLLAVYIFWKLCWFSDLCGGPRRRRSVGLCPSLVDGAWPSSPWGCCLPTGRPATVHLRVASPRFQCPRPLPPVAPAGQDLGEGCLPEFSGWCCISISSGLCYSLSRGCRDVKRCHIVSGPCRSELFR